MLRAAIFAILVLCLLSPIDAQAKKKAVGKQDHLVVHVLSLDRSFFDRIGVDTGWTDRFTLSDIEAYFLLKNGEPNRSGRPLGFPVDELWHCFPTNKIFQSQYRLIANCEKTSKGDSRLIIKGQALTSGVSISESVALKRNHAFFKLLEDLDNKHRVWLLQFSR